MYCFFNKFFFKVISIHALREEGDESLENSLVSARISIHALREEGDSLRYARTVRRSDFYPRPPRGGRRNAGTAEADAEDHFYPRPPRGGRRLAKIEKTPEPIFLSTPSARRATSVCSGRVRPLLFLSTPSARRATAKTETKSLFSNKLYNILHEFRRALIYNGSKNYPNHAK